LCATAVQSTPRSRRMKGWFTRMPTVPQRVKKHKPIYTIYALVDPRDQSVRYIGVTYDVFQRMRQHSRCEGNNKAKNAWVEELQRIQQMFIMRSLEQVDAMDEALIRESYWIQRYLREGANLFNIAGIAESFDRPKKPLLNLATLFIHMRDGSRVTTQDAPDELFDMFIRHFVTVTGDNSWDKQNRRLAIEHCWKQGVSLPLFDENGVLIEPPAEGE